jgi:hypothetical protein
MKIRATLALSASMLALCFAACSKKSDDAAKTGNVNLNFLSTDAGSTELRLAENGTFADLPLSTSASERGLSSMKMYFREIKLCTSLKFDSGTGYTVDGPCASIYSNMDDEYTGTEAPTAADRTRFAAADEGKFYDILSDSDLEKLSRGVAIEAAEYNYGIIETHPWVKFVAKNGTLCTKAAGAEEKEATGGDGVKTYNTTVDSVSCDADESAEEVLTFITNANSTFKFLKPFVVAENDDVTVDLAFNLDSEIKSIANTDTVPGGMKGADGSGSFYVPMIRLGAAPRTANQTTKVETYLLGTEDSKERIRTQLYYNSADKDKTILGVNFTVLATPSSTKTKANNPIYGSSITEKDDVVTVESWDGSELLSFTRGAAGTATIACKGTGGGAALEECDGKTNNTLTYEAPTTSDL